MTKTKLVVGVDSGFTDSYRKFFEEKYDLEIYKFKEIVDSYEKEKDVKFPDLLIFTGGADVNPELYGENVGKFTGVDEKRDTKAQQICNIFYNTPKVGICRGSQFLTVLAGGKLVQHVTGHAGANHEITLVPKLGYIGKMSITSTHHQMMFPFKMSDHQYDILGYSTYYKSDTYLNGDNQEIKLPPKFVEPEIVYYSGISGLAIQGHPEMDGCPKGTKRTCLQLIDRFLLNPKKI